MRVSEHTEPGGVLLLKQKEVTMEGKTAL